MIKLPQQTTYKFCKNKIYYLFYFLFIIFLVLLIFTAIYDKVSIFILLQLPLFFIIFFINYYRCKYFFVKIEEKQLLYKLRFFKPPVIISFSKIDSIEINMFSIVFKMKDNEIYKFDLSLQELSNTAEIKTFFKELNNKIQLDKT